MNKPPAFQFYPDDFIGGTVDFSAQEVGAYVRLLCYQWGRESIPDDRKICDRIAGCKVTDAVLAKFPNGKNNRIEAEREKQQIWREKSRQGGLHSAASRGSRVVQPPLVPNGQPNANRPVELCLQPNGNIPLSTLHSPPSNEDRKERESGNFPQCPPMTRTEFNTLCQLRAVPADCAEWFWNTHDAVNWLDGQKRPIQKVEPLLMRTLASWRANGGAGNGKAAHGTGLVANRPKTPLDLKTIIQAKETLAGDIRKKHCSDVAMGDSWTNDQKKAEYFKLKREIKELNTQISSMA